MISERFVNNISNVTAIFWALCFVFRVWRMAAMVLMLWSSHLFQSPLVFSAKRFTEALNPQGTREKRLPSWLPDVCDKIIPKTSSNPQRVKTVKHVSFIFYKQKALNESLLSPLVLGLSNTFRAEVVISNPVSSLKCIYMNMRHL